MEEAGGKELTNQGGTTNLIRACGKVPRSHLLCVFIAAGSLTRHFHTGRKGKALKVSLMYFSTFSMDSAIVMVTLLFKTSDWDLHPYSILKRESNGEALSHTLLDLDS